MREVGLTGSPIPTAGVYYDETPQETGNITRGGGRCAVHNLDFRIDLVVPAGELEGAIMSAYGHKGLLIDVTYARPQVAIHLQRGSATNNGHSRRYFGGAQKRALCSFRTRAL